MVLACTSTAPTASTSSHGSESLGLAHARVVVLPFAGVASPPTFGVPGAMARLLVQNLLVEQFGATVVSQRAGDGPAKDQAFAQGKYDRDAVQALTQELGAEVAVWGTVDRYTRRRSGSPGEVPRVSLTLYGLRVGQASVVRVSGSEQGAFVTQSEVRETQLESDVSTFPEVAEPLIRRLLAAVR